MPGLLKLPPGAEIRDAHGLELDADHKIYLTYGNFATAKAKPNNGAERRGRPVTHYASPRSIFHAYENLLVNLLLVV
jgi:hypothetical protein